MQMLEFGHESFVDMIANTIARSATNHAVSALMRGHGVIAILGMCCVLVLAVWLFKRILQ